MKGSDVPADFHYYNWVDQHDIGGFGENTPIATGSNSDSLLVLDPDSGEWTTLRVPYPLGFFSRGLDGRIDDPDAGWKGRALWPTTARTTSGTPRAARAPAASSSSSRSGRIRWRGSATRLR